MKRTFEISTAAVLLILSALVMLLMTIFNLGTPMDTFMPAQTAQMPPGAASPEEILAMVRNINLGLQAAELVFSLLAAVGLWRLSKWGFWLGVILAILKVLGGLPIFFQPTMPIVPETFAQLAVGLIVLILLFLRDSRALFFPPR